MNPVERALDPVDGAATSIENPPAGAGPAGRPESPVRADAFCHHAGMGSVSDYLAGIEDDGRRAALERVIGVARTAVPDVEEGVSYGMPALKYRGKPLVAAVAAKQHLSVFPFSGSVVDAVAPDLVGFSLSRGTIRFDVDHPIPDAVLEQVIRLRIDEIDAGS